MKVTVLITFLVGCSLGQTFNANPLRDVMLAADLDKARPTRQLCTAPLTSSPLIRGKVRLGMKQSNYKPLGVVLMDVGRAADIDLTPTFFNGKLIRLEVTYRNSIKWDADAEFAYVIADEFKLPVNAWRALESGGLAMFCDGWTVVARSNYLDLMNEKAIAAKSKAEARTADGDRKRTFKP